MVSFKQTNFRSTLTFSEGYIIIIFGNCIQLARSVLKRLITSLLGQSKALNALVSFTCRCLTNDFRGKFSATRLGTAFKMYALSVLKWIRPILNPQRTHVIHSICLIRITVNASMKDGLVLLRQTGFVGPSILVQMYKAP